MTKLPLKSNEKQLAELVERGLANVGQGAITFDEQWFTNETDKYPTLSISVPIGSTLTITLRPRFSGSQDATSDELARYAKDLVVALINLQRAGAFLRAYHAKMSSTAKRQVDKAQADGVQISLTSVGFKSVSAWQLTSECWEDAAAHVIAEVRLHVLSRIRGNDDQELRLIVEEIEDLEEEIEEVIDDWKYSIRDSY